MFCSIYMCNSMLIIPTLGKVGNNSGYRDIEPVLCIHLSEEPEIRQAMKRVFMSENPIIKRPDYPLTPVVLKYANVKTWAEFSRKSKLWHVSRDKNRYIIYRTKRNGSSWVPERGQNLEFPIETSVEDVVEYVIELIRSS